MTLADSAGAKPDLSGLSMLLSILAGSYAAQAEGICFRAYGASEVACGISRDALLDLGGYHKVGGSEEALLRALGPEIERLISAKFRARRIDKNGEIWIGSADILLYGFEARPGLAKAG
jgi:hypothetical protein